MLKKNLVGTCAIACLLLSANFTYAQNLPSAEKVIDTYIEKTGGRMKYNAIKNAKFSGEMSIPAAGIKGTVDITFVAPDKFHFKADMGEFVGVQERGSNGKVVWENSTAQGARLIKGDEADQMLQEISMGTILNPKKFYKSMKNAGKEKVNGEECYMLEMTKKNGDVDKDYYSVKSGLRIKSVKKVESPLGKIEVESFDKDYKKANNGLLVSWTGEQKVGPNSIVLKMKSVEFNGKVDKSKFAIPAEIKELIDN